MSNLLEMKNICKSFPGVKALDNVSLNIKKGKIHSLVGENGAGKSTLIKVLSGAYVCDTGTVTIEGERITDFTPGNMIEKGVAVIYQEFMLAEHMTVAENIFLDKLFTTKLGKIDYDKMKKEAQKIIDHLGVNINPEAKVCELSVAKKQMVEIAKALSRKAKIIVLDEPTAVLGENELKGMFNIVRKLADQGVAFIYISHRLKEVFDLSDKVTVMKDGQVVVTDDISNFNIERLVNSMVGRQLSDIYPKRNNCFSEEVMVVKGLNRGNIIKNINFSLRKGEILAISGLVGAGRTEVLKAILGADKIDSGEIEICGRKVIPKSPKETIKLGIGLLPEERKIEGLCLSHPITFNVSISSFKEMTHLFLINLKKEVKLVKKFIERIKVRPNNHKMTVKNLSGGNQQKVVFSKWLNAKCKILLVDEPTRGIDVGAKQEIYKLINELTQEGLSVVMVSSELPEVLGISDRVLVMHQGEIVAELDTKETSEEEIMMYATGQKKNNNCAV